MAEIAFDHYAARKSDFVNCFYEELQESERFKPKEIRSAVKMQSLCRMFLQRKQFLIAKAAATRIKSTYKGFQARKAYWEMTDKDISQKQLSFYQIVATAIQKSYRGYYSRKYIHDFYARKKYLQHIKDRNEKRRQKLEVYHLKNEADHQRRQEDNARLEFYQLASSLHHLTSTKAIQGVYSHLEAVSDFGRHTLI